MKKDTKRSAKPATEPEPDWLETPDDMHYIMSMDANVGEYLQEVDLTREEYIALKAHLAKLRGCAAPKAA